MYWKICSLYSSYPRNMKKILWILTYSIFGMIGVVVSVVMISEPYYFHQIWKAISSMVQRIKTNSNSGVKIFSILAEGREKVDINSWVQSYKIPNLKNNSGMNVWNKVLHYVIDIKDLGNKELIISHGIQTWSINIMGYIPSFSSYFSPLALPYVANINLFPENNITCFSIRKYSQDKISDCYPISLFRWTETKYLDYMILGIYSENESDITMYFK